MFGRLRAKQFVELAEDTVAKLLSNELTARTQNPRDLTWEEGFVQDDDRRPIAPEAIAIENAEESEVFASWTIDPDLEVAGHIPVHRLPHASA